MAPSNSIATAVSSPPSAAARVFAIFELFEKIVLELIASEIASPAVRPNAVTRYFNGVQPQYIEDQFRLLRVNRHTYSTIMNSKPIQAQCFAPTSLQAYFAYPNRVVWLSLGCGRFMLPRNAFQHPVILFPAEAKWIDDLDFDDSPCASWRRYPVMPSGCHTMTFMVMRRSAYLYHELYNRDDEEIELHVKPEWTLGKLYDEILEVEPAELKPRTKPDWLKRHQAVMAKFYRST